MTARTSVTTRVSLETKEKLSRMTADGQRSKSSLTAEALATYDDRGLEIITGIKRGMTDAEAARVTPHDEAMAEIYEAIDAAESKQTGKAQSDRLAGRAKLRMTSRNR